MQRRISLSVRPSARRFSTYSRVTPSWVILTIATMCNALFRDRSPPRFNRCRTVFPVDAGIGFTPAREANAASLRTLPSWDHAARHFAALIALNPHLLQQRCGLADLHQIVQLVLVGRELLIQREDVFGQPHGLDTGDGQGKLSRARHFETSVLWASVSFCRASMPKSLPRTSALSALTDRVRSLLMGPRAVTRIRTPWRTPS